MAADLTAAPSPAPSAAGRVPSGGMGKVAVRGLVDHKMRLLSTIAAVALGVGFMAGVLVLTDTMNKSFDDIFATAFEGTDAVVRSSQAIETEFGDEIRSRLDASLLDTVRAADGVAEAEGSVQGFARIVDQDGDPVGDPGFGPPTFGANWITVDQLNGFTVADGRAPQAADEVVIDRRTADETDYQVGDSVRVQHPQGVDDYELVGIARFGNADSPGGATYALWITEEAQRTVGEPGRFDSINAVAAGGVSQSEVAGAIEDELTSAGDTDLEVLTGEQITEESQDDLKDQLSFLTTFFLVFAVVALGVGTFVIYNSFSIIVAQRTREMALMRAVGASRRQVRRAVLIEALAIGLLGALVGVLLGLALAQLLVGLFGIEGSLVIGPRTVIIALVIGVVVTLTSALVPARRASKVPPVAAMRDVSIDTTGRSRLRLVAGVIVAGVGVAAVVTGATEREVAAVGLGVFLSFVSLILLGPALAGPISRLVGRPLGRVRGVTGTLARQNAGRNPRRTSATAQALMIGVGLVSFFLVVNDSIRQSIDDVLGESFTGDFVINAGFGPTGLPAGPDGVAATVAELPEVADVVPVRFTPAESAGDNIQVTGTTGAAVDTFSLSITDGSGALDPGEIVLDADTADERRLGIGDAVDIAFVDTGTHTFTVAGISDATEANSIGNYVIGLEDYTAAVPLGTDGMVIVELAPGVSIEEAQPEIEAVVEPFATADVQSAAQFADAIKDQLNILLLLILGLLALAIIIALLGIMNTIALSVLERTRELGLLRAVGMSRRQLRSTIRSESVIIALFGTLLGLAFGLLGGWGMVTAFRDEGFEVFSIPYAELVAVVIVAAGAGILAALWPAWRASRMNVLDAIHEE
ncbi:MAG TPA: ABC transporter permease [Acidimicrobiales bacterium]|nr:ABC transporter permease [Acidimicrobiales bacterium]